MSDSLADWWNVFWREFGPEMIATFFIVGGAFVLLAVLKRGISRWLRKVEQRYAESDDHTDRERGQRLLTITMVMKMLVSIVVWAIVVLTTMGTWGLPMAPLIAVGTTVGIAVGFGAQDLVRDIISGFFILIEDQFGIGDVVAIAGVSGTVESIRLRTTVLRDLNGNVHHVPNGHIEVASNRTPDYARIVADIGVSYDTDIDRAMEVILDEATLFANDPDWSASFLKKPQMLGVDELADSAVLIRVLATVVTEERWAVKREFLRRIKNRLDAEKIEIPFNYMTVVLQDGGEGSSR